MSRRFCLLTSAFCVLAAAAGCRQDMHNSVKAIPLRESVFFKNGSSARPLVPDTVARGTLQDDSAFFTGKIGTTPDTLAGKQLIPFDFPGQGKHQATVTWSLTR